MEYRDFERWKLWQHLPLNEVSPGQDSPYAASSSFALEPVYVDLRVIPDLEALTPEEEGVLARLRREPRVDFEGHRRVGGKGVTV